MTTVVADAWALLALLRGEGQAAQQVRRWFRRAKSGSVRIVINIVNLGEVHYRVAQIAGQGRADQTLDVVRRLPLEILPAKEPLVFAAARIKANYRLSYADAFAVATGQAERAPVLTGDPEILTLPRSVVAVRRLDRG